jgi:hypothetical protein
VVKINIVFEDLAEQEPLRRPRDPAAVDDSVAALGPTEEIAEV